MTKPDSSICLECERLWRDYQRATNEHLSLLNRLRAGVPGKQSAEAVIREVSAAEFNRKKVKEALDAHHESTGHR